MHLLIRHSCIVHVENVVQELVAAEAEGTEGQEELYQELEVAEPVEEPFSVTDLANPESQPGKHRKHISQYFIQV